MYIFLKGILYFALILGSARAISVEGPPELQDLDASTVPTAADRVRDMKAAPAWVRELHTKTVAEYFPENFSDKSLDWKIGAQALMLDAIRLHNYYEPDENFKLYKGFVEKKLIPFINKINKKKLTSALRNNTITRPIGEWTVENLVVTEQVAYLGRYPNFIKNTLGLFSGRHLRGASATAGVIVLGAVGAYTAYYFDLPALSASSAAVVGGVVGGAIYGAFQAGPLAAILNAATSWFIQPTTEYVHVLKSRWLGGWEQAINNFYDKLKPKSSDNADSKRNERPNIATVEKDGMNFAGMTPEEQRNNWDMCIDMWVGVVKTFNQLVRGVHHTGRALMFVNPNDEQMTTILVETMDSKLNSLSIQAEALLSPYKVAILVDARLDAEERVSRLAKLEANFDLHQHLHLTKLLNLDLDADSLRKLDMEISLVNRDLLESGMTSRDLSKLTEIQKQHSKDVSTIVTALTLNEIRAFGVAESNRNLDGPARQIQRTIRNGFHLQSYVDKYLDHIQTMMVKMGYQNSRKPLPVVPASPIMTCRGIFG
ncbi:MAG: hypothetical protein SGJ18_02125 [Pseudomonadota bacterium]|nr:hypothetical protein [Pseudomonadota bacterium]